MEEASCLLLGLTEREPRPCTLLDSSLSLSVSPELMTYSSETMSHLRHCSQTERSCKLLTWGEWSVEITSETLNHKCFWLFNELLQVLKLGCCYCSSSSSSSSSFHTLWRTTTPLSRPSQPDLATRTHTPRNRSPCRTIIYISATKERLGTTGEERAGLSAVEGYYRRHTNFDSNFTKFIFTIVEF